MSLCSIQVIALLLLAVAPTSSPEAPLNAVRYIDLAEASGQSVTESIQPGERFYLGVEHTVQNRAYRLSATVETVPLDAFTWPARETPEAPQPAEFLEGARDVCAPLIGEQVNAFGAVSEAMTEHAVREAIRRLAQAVRDIEVVPACSPNPALSVSRAQQEHRISLASAFTLRPGERLTFTVTSTETDGTPTVWTHVYTTGARGQWVTSYGPAVVTDAFGDQDTFYAEPQPVAEGGEPQYLLRRQADRQAFHPAAAAFFTWMPAHSERNTFTPTGSGYIGLDTDGRFALGAGGTVVYNYNLMLHLGLALHSQEALLEKYRRPDQDGSDVEVGSNLSFDELHAPAYRVGLFTALTFRFGAAPPPTSGIAARPTAPASTNPAD